MSGYPPPGGGSTACTFGWAPERQRNARNNRIIVFIGAELLKSPPICRDQKLKSPCLSARHLTNPTRGSIAKQPIKSRCYSHLRCSGQRDRDARARGRVQRGLCLAQQL